MRAKQQTVSEIKVTPVGWIGLSIALLMVVGTYTFLPPDYQNESYHHFTDHRSWAGIPNLLNVISNVIFAGVGLLGLWKLLQDRQRTLDEKLPWWVFFGGVIAVSLGSSYYHLNPNDATLFWDRLPMTWVFMGLLAAAIPLHIPAWPVRKGLAILLVVGSASLWTWISASLSGSGDLRFYGLIQFGGTTLAVMGFFFSSLSRDQKSWILISAVLYGFSKIFEWLDYSIYAHFAHIVSGHTIKHVLAALSAGCYIPVLWGRRGVLPSFCTALWDLLKKKISLKKTLFIFLFLVVAVAGWARWSDEVVSKCFFWPWPYLRGEKAPAGVKVVHITSADGGDLEAWWLKGDRYKGPQNKPVILFLHGNAGNIDIQFHQFAYLQKWGYDVLALDYRGFGNSTGNPSRAGLDNDVEDAWRYLKVMRPNAKIAVVGHSMGTVFALRLAKRHPEMYRLVILAPFADFSEIGEWVLRQWGFSDLLAKSVAWWFIQKRCEPMSSADSTPLPTALFVHGSDDRVIPYAMGEKVFQTYRGEKRFLRMEGYGHQDFFEGPSWGSYQRVLDGFLEGSLVGEKRHS